MGVVCAPMGSSLGLNCNNTKNLETDLAQSALKNRVDGPVDETAGNVTEGPSAYQHTQSNVTHDVDCFRETRGRNKSSAKLTSTCVQHRSAAADCQSNSGNGVVILGQQSGSYATKGSPAHDNRRSQQTRKRGRLRKEMANKQVHLCGSPDDVHTIGQPMTPDTMEDP